jgi:hypothetical protein
MLFCIILSSNLTYASPTNLKQTISFDVEEWEKTVVFAEVEVYEGDKRHKKTTDDILIKDNIKTIENLKNIYSNEELYRMIEDNLYQAIEDQKNGSFIIWNNDVVENKIKYQFPNIYKEIKENELLNFDYTFFSDKDNNVIRSAGFKNFTFSLLFEAAFGLNIMDLSSYLEWKYDSNGVITSVISDDYMNVYGYWEDLGINASHDTYSYDRKTCTHYTEAKTRHNPLIGPTGSIIYPWMKMELTQTYGKLKDSGIK